MRTPPRGIVISPNRGIDPLGPVRPTLPVTATESSSIAGHQMVIAAAVTDPVQSVRRNVEKLLASPLVPSRVAVSGHVYDVDTGLVETVVSVAVGACRYG